MDAKEEILDNNKNIGGHRILISREYVLEAMEEYANRRIVEVLEDIYSKKEFIKMWAAIGNKIKELKSKSDPNDLPPTVGGGFGGGK